MFVVNKEE